ncbi:MAG TPA: hypothetical protein VFV86_12465 [Nitrososphaeraceae archaeon]|nr:hypothetical protein [Nitrososphaeraceae archaeon]
MHNNYRTSSYFIQIIIYDFNHIANTIVTITLIAGALASSIDAHRSQIEYWSSIMHLYVQRLFYLKNLVAPYDKQARKRIIYLSFRHGFVH